MNNKGLIITASSLLVVIIGLSMYIAWWADDVAYNNAVTKNTVRAYKDFIKEYPKSEFAHDCQLRYDELAYREAVAMSTEGGYNDYIKNHPQSIYVDSVKALLEPLLFESAMNSTDVTACVDYLNKYPESEKQDAITKRMEEIEDEYFRTRINIPLDKISKSDLQEYERLFPRKKYASQVAAKLDAITDQEDYESVKDNDNEFALRGYLERHPNGKYRSVINAKIQEIRDRDRYLNNSLANGSQPYRSYYGANTTKSYGMSAVTVTAPYSCDVVVTARLKSDNKVKGHVYVRAGQTASFRMPAGTYNISFYYGKGWYPKKKMVGSHGTVYGGFLSDESVGKDKDVYFPANSGYTYTLRMVQNGNFSTTPSSTYEMF